MFRVCSSWGMSTRVVRCLQDFVRHGYPIDVDCPNGHSNTLDARTVLAWFTDRGLSTSLYGSFLSGGPYARFYCARCLALGRGVVRPKHIGPKYR